jgi:M6 family metalloprotease-like protein
MNREISPRIYYSAFCSAFLVAMVVLVGSIASRAQTNSTPTDSPAAARMRALNNSLLSLHGQMQAASVNDARLLRSPAADVIAQRAAALTQLIQNNPHAALTFAFSPELLADLATKFPGSSSLLESHMTITGPVQHWIADSPGLKMSRSVWQMNAGGGRSINLYFQGHEPANLKSNQLLQATGVLAGSEMAVETSAPVQSSSLSIQGPRFEPLPNADRAKRGQLWPTLAMFVFGLAFVLPGLEGRIRLSRKQGIAVLKHLSIYVLVFAFVLGSTPSFAQNLCSTTGVQNVAVLLVTFPGATLPTSVAQLQDVFFAANTAGVSLDGFLREASYGQTSATGGVFGPYTLTGSYTSCSDVGGAVLTDAISAAIASGVNLNNYNRVVLVFPNIFNCFWGGFANVGGCSIYYSPSNTSYNASISYIVADATTDRATGVEYASHELGHNLGLLHSGTITTTNSTDVLGPVSSPGTFWDQGGDYWSTMGELALGLYPAPQKAEVLGWMTPSSNYQVVQSTGTYTIQPLETNPAGLQALKVQRGTANSEWLWIEYRQAIGNYDSTFIANGETQPYYGALIHYEDSTVARGHTYLPNFTPTVTSGLNPALAAGQTWTDPYTNLSLSVLSATSSGLTIGVNYGATSCTSSAPSVSVSPLNPSIYPGQSAGYSVSVTNNDSSGCSSDTISFGSTEPSGWSTSLSTSSVTLSPGQSASVTMGKVAPSGTPAGTYAVNLSAATTSSSTSGTANATVMTPPSLAVSISPSGSTFTAPGTVSITAFVTNGGTPASGASVTFTVTAPTGSSTTQTITTGSNGIGTWNYRLNGKSIAGTYSVVAQAALSSGGKKNATTTQSATSNTASFVVQ